MAAAIADEGESPIPMLELSPMIFKARDIFFAICFSPLNKWLQPVILSMNELFVFFEIQGENFLREQTIMLHLEVTDMRLLMMVGSMIKIIKKSKKKMTNHSLYLLTKKVTAHTQESPTVNVKQQLIGGKKILINGKW